MRIVGTYATGRRGIGELNFRPARHPLEDILLRLLDALSRCESVIEIHLEVIGDDVAGPPSRRLRYRKHLKEQMTVEGHLSPWKREQLRQKRTRLVNRVLALPGASGMGHLAAERQRRMEGAHRSHLDHVVGRLHSDCECRRSQSR